MVRRRLAAWSNAEGERQMPIGTLRKRARRGIALTGAAVLIVGFGVLSARAHDQVQPVGLTHNIK